MISSKGVTMTSTEKRNHLINSFIKLVAEKGMAASGVDSIAKYANVSKKTIYNQFGNKESLAIEALATFSQQVKNQWVCDRAEITDPKELLLHFFTELEDIIKQGTFHGCIFVNMCREYPGLDHEIHQTAKEHKDAASNELLSRLRKAGFDNSEKLFQIELIYEGLISKLIVYQDITMIDKVKKIVLEMAE
jgi:AcrR family transcriptional regulator